MPTSRTQFPGTSEGKLKIYCNELHVYIQSRCLHSERSAEVPQRDRVGHQGPTCGGYQGVS